MAVVMVPTGWHKGSKWHWQATVGSAVDFSKCSELTPDQLRWLNYTFPSGRACIWATSKHNDWPQPGAGLRVLLINQLTRALRS